MECFLQVIDEYSQKVVTPYEGHYELSVIRDIVLNDSKTSVRILLNRLPTDNQKVFCILDDLVAQATEMADDPTIALANVREIHSWISRNRDQKK